MIKVKIKKLEEIEVIGQKRSFGNDWFIDTGDHFSHTKWFEKKLPENREINLKEYLSESTFDINPDTIESIIITSGKKTFVFKVFSEVL